MNETLVSTLLSDPASDITLTDNAHTNESTHSHRNVDQAEWESPSSNGKEPRILMSDVIKFHSLVASEQTSADWSSADTRSLLSHKNRAVKPIGRVELWWLEITFCLVILGVLAGLVFTLHKYDGKPIPRFGGKITLNTFIAILDAIIILLLVRVLGNCIGAAKWSVMREPRPAFDMSVYDDASRDWFGAGTLLWYEALGLLDPYYRRGITSMTSRAPYIPSLGALVTMLAVAFDAMNQTSLDY